MKQVVGVRKTHKKITGKLFNKISDKVKSLFAVSCVAQAKKLPYKYRRGQRTYGRIAFIPLL